MLSRRMFLGGLSAGVPVVLMPGLARAELKRVPRIPPRVHAMVIGINTYTGLRGDGRPIGALKGCLNDAADIERQVRRLQPAFFRRLGWDAAAAAERPVTRADVLGAWRDMMAAAQARDTVLLSFAGHGSRIPVLPGNPGNEADGYDETLVLTGWDASQGRNAEHIIDDELDEMFHAAHRKAINVVFVADCSHSGGLARSVPSLLFLAASQESEHPPEIVVDGQYRGPLSVALARALEGRAADTDGIITASSLTRFVLGHVRDLVDSTNVPERSVNANPIALRGSGIQRDTVLFKL
jgi:hypothetical protein